MTTTLRSFALATALLSGAAAGQLAAPPVPDAVADLRTEAGAALVSARWQALPARIGEVDFRAAGADRKPSGPPNRTHALHPRLGGEGWKDGAWEAVAAGDLETRRGDGQLSFVWYRVQLTLPDTLGGFDVAGSSAVLELVVDDYAEVSVDGALPLVLGTRGGQSPAGWNAPQRVLLGHGLQPGRSFDIAILAANGPFSALPENYVWLRSATVDFYAAGRLDAAQDVPLIVESGTAALEALLGAEPRAQRVASGFLFAEGPVWHPDGSLLFSDPNANVIQRWVPGQGTSILRTKSGYAGADIGRYRQPGSNGLALDAEGRLIACEHGRRRVVRWERNGDCTVLAERDAGRRLNSPNDVVIASDGTIYFTDPPFGLPAFHDDPARELPYCGVYALKDGELRLLNDELLGPNGVALSPDERFLYVTNWDSARKIVMRWPRHADGTLGAGEVFFDMGEAPFEEALDGLEVDALGNLWVAGPGGLWVLAPDGQHLGTLVLPELPSNFAWGEDGSTLYITARTGLYRLPTLVRGAAVRSAARG